MAFLEMKYTSEVMQLRTSINILIPQQRVEGQPLNVLWLLHGLSDDHTGWMRLTSIERYVEDKNLCVIMPCVDRSFYTDMAYGNKYFTFLTEELPEALSVMFNLSRKREHNYVAGLSMGGYGAFKVGLNYPDRYCKAASLSGALDFEYIYQSDHGSAIDHERLMQLIHGNLDNFVHSRSDLNHMAELRAKENNLPDLYMCCGKADFLYGCNQRYLHHLKALGIPITYEEEEGYEHSWAYWDLKIQRVIQWMGI